MLARQEAEKKYYEILQEEEHLKVEINNVKIENEKIQNQLEEKVKGMEECLHNQEQQSRQAIDQQRILHERMLNQVREDCQSRINNLQGQLNRALERKPGFWDSMAGVAGGIAGGLLGGVGGLIGGLFRGLF
ncbi:1550_t:CDS:1 [Dentiscutata erythropus]|uniref:1550_t:CDS:1 n=1 Tax=Dentiscutata erythropus TaxID=1348616 RepID=A0A9N9K1B8_9GLOM|nr:1550_t:CDS:1 [Dentiscutata erythropus]